MIFFGDSYGKLNFVNLEKFLLKKDDIKRLNAHDNWIS